MSSTTAPGTARERVGAGTVLAAFLRLGCTSFGGPIAHLGYLRDEFVVRRQWLEEGQFAEIIALAQTLPGPASSQVGFTIGLLKGGWPGALAAWTGFTLPSAALMVAFAFAHREFAGPHTLGIIHGLQIVAVAVIAQAVLMMQRGLARDRVLATIAVLGAAVALLAPAYVGTLAAIGAGAVAGAIFCRAASQAATPSPLRFAVSRTTGAVLCSLFLLLLAAPPLILTRVAAPWLAEFEAFYRSGALVFGGGHVVLPLLQSATVAKGWLSEQTFLAGYGAAQVVPGPLFTFAAYLGADLNFSPNGTAGGCLALASIFLPGLMLVAGILPFWAQLRERRVVRAALAGVNASVVGVLGAALYKPVWVSTILRPLDFVIALAAFVLLVQWRVHPWKVVVLTAAVSAIFLR
ncbi:MAG TPA: chromate efflux transporter [Candidatus Acidoferrales bacterium]|nr:chromate efflux transporter [Candidatus Acidoferrales bacterium]